MEEAGTESVKKADKDKVKIKRRKSSKRPTRKHSIKVRRKRSQVRRSVSVRKGKAVRTKSFIVKRRSFLRPTKWSSYLRDERKGRFHIKLILKELTISFLDHFCQI